MTTGTMTTGTMTMATTRPREYMVHSALLTFTIRLVRPLKREVTDLYALDVDHAVITLVPFLAEWGVSPQVATSDVMAACEAALASGHAVGWQGRYLIRKIGEDT